MSIPATGAVLAGGLSSRFGTNKALAPWADGKLIEGVTGRLLEIFPAVLVLAKDPDQYAFLKRSNLDIVSDRRTRVHPLSGLYSALEHARSEYVFVCGCDMPFINRKLIARLWKEARGYEAAAPIWDGKIQPLCAFYSKGCAQILGRMLARGLAPRDLFDLARTRRLSEEEVRSEDAKGLSFLDIDTPEDYAHAKTCFSKT